MLATAGPAPTGDDWAAEVKFDGIRAQVICDRRVLRLRSRRGRLCTEEFPETLGLVDVLERRRVVLDAELVCLGPDGKPDFHALRARLGQRGARAVVAAQQHPATLMVFDVLHLDGRAVRDLPYWRRRGLLAQLALDGPARTPRHFIGAGDALLAATAEQGLEGIVAKRLGSRYTEGKRSASWVKTKHRRRERLVVTGWRELGDDRLPEFLLARVGQDGSLRPAGSATLGLDAMRRGELLDALREHELPARQRRSSVRWVIPGPIEVTADAHGRVDGPVRDAVLREVHVPSNGSSAPRTQDSAKSS